MVIAALISFAILLVAWILAPEAERRSRLDDATLVSTDAAPLLEAA